MAAAVATRVRRRRTFAQQQAAIRQRTVDAADTTNWSNPVAGNANLREIELEKVSADDAKTKKIVSSPTDGVRPPQAEDNAEASISACRKHWGRKLIHNGPGYVSCRYTSSTAKNM